MSAGEIVGLVLGVLSIFALLVAGMGWFIKQKIREFTYPIQPNANGGSSLPDAIDRIKKVEHRLDMLLELVSSVLAHQERHANGLEFSRSTDGGRDA